MLGRYEISRQQLHKCGEREEDPGIYSLRTSAKLEPVRRLDPLFRTRPVGGFLPVFQFPVPAGTYFQSDPVKAFFRLSIFQFPN